MSASAMPHMGASPLRPDTAPDPRADAAAAQDAFMRRVVHDLRAPLRHVTSYGALVRELLGELPSPPEQVVEALDHVATMEQSARRMAAMLDGLRVIAEAQSVPLRLQEVPLGGAVQDARAQLAAGQAGRAVQWDVPADLPAVCADAALLRALLQQVLGNALKFTRGRAPARIAVRAEPAGEQVRITVEDNGAGFDPARAQALFGVFERLHREAEFEGVGAGLALCRTIARRHGAELAITARPEVGCTVQLHWPAARTAPA